MRKNKERLEYLRAVSLFAACSDKELAEVASVAEELRVPEGEVLTVQGKVEHEFYVIADGSASVVRDGSLVATLGPGDHFGELALLDPSPRSATVTMTSSGSVLQICEPEFWRLVHDVPTLSRKLLQGLARRLHES